MPQRETPGRAAKPRALSPDDNPLVRAVGRVPARSTPSSSSPSWLPRCWSWPSASSVCACSGSRTSGWNPSASSRGAPPRTASFEATPGTSACSSPATSQGTSTRSSRSPIETRVTGPWISRRWTRSTRSGPRCTPRTSGSYPRPRTSSTSGGSARRAPTSPGSWRESSRQEMRDGKPRTPIAWTQRTLYPPSESSPSSSTTRPRRGRRR